MTALTSNSHVNMEVVPEAEPVAATEGTATVVEADEALVALADMALADLGARGDRGDLVGPVVALLSMMTKMALDPSANPTTIQFSKRGLSPFTSRTSRRPNGLASPK